MSSTYALLTPVQQDVALPIKRHLCYSITDSSIPNPGTHGRGTQLSAFSAKYPPEKAYYPCSETENYGVTCIYQSSHKQNLSPRLSFQREFPLHHSDLQNPRPHSAIVPLDRWAFVPLAGGTLRGVAPQFVPSNDSAAGGQRAFKMPVGLNQPTDH